MTVPQCGHAAALKARPFRENTRLCRHGIGLQILAVPFRESQVQVHAVIPGELIPVFLLAASVLTEYFDGQCRQRQPPRLAVFAGNRLVADSLEREWNDRLRALAAAREERTRARQRDDVVLDDAIRQRLAALTTDFRTLWDDPATANRERKRLLAYIIEDATLIKIPAEGITKIHVRFKGGRVYSEIAAMLNQRGFRPGASARPGRAADRFSAVFHPLSKGVVVLHV